MDLNTISCLIKAVDWATLANIAVVVAAVIVVLQLSEMRRTTLAQAYSVAREILQNETVRDARGSIFRLRKREDPVNDWFESEVKDAEIVCHTYDSVGHMVRNGLLPKKIIIDSWGPSLRRSWPVLKPLIYHYRMQWDAPEVWDDFEWLATEAQKADDRRKKWRQLLRKLGLSSKS